MNRNRKTNFMAILLFLTGMLCAAGIFFVGWQTYRRTIQTEEALDKAMEPIREKQRQLKEDEEFLTNYVASQETVIRQKQQKQLTASQQIQERDPSAANTETAGPSVFSQVSGSNGSADFSAGEGNGHIVGIDPGHQGPNVDMSDTEPIGPGSSERKTRSSAGTTGSFTGLPEYQLNLDISLKLRDMLQSRGYQVVMTRTDNDTAISNMERAQYITSQGAEICVRIHANGDDTHTASGALTMVPSPDNPYVSQLSGESVRLAQCILDSYCAATGFSSLGVQYYDNMAGINWSTVPVTILEMGFMTYESDDRQMSDAAFQDRMVRGIADGIDAYFAQ